MVLSLICVQKHVLKVQKDFVSWDRFWSHSTLNCMKQDMSGLINISISSQLFFVPSVNTMYLRPSARDLSTCKSFLIILLQQSKDMEFRTLTAEVPDQPHAPECRQRKELIKEYRISVGFVTILKSGGGKLGLLRAAT